MNSNIIAVLLTTLFILQVASATTPKDLKDTLKDKYDEIGWKDAISLTQALLQDNKENIGAIDSQTSGLSLADYLKEEGNFGDIDGHSGYDDDDDDDDDCGGEPCDGDNSTDDDEPNDDDDGDDDFLDDFDGNDSDDDAGDNSFDDDFYLGMKGDQNVDGDNDNDDDKDDMDYDDDYDYDNDDDDTDDDDEEEGEEAEEDSLFYAYFNDTAKTLNDDDDDLVQIEADLANPSDVIADDELIDGIDRDLGDKDGDRGDQDDGDDSWGDSQLNYDDDA